MTVALRPQVLERIAQTWSHRLAPYRKHRNVEHLEALVDEAVHFAGFELEGRLGRSPFWCEFPLIYRAAVLLFLVDRGIVERRTRAGRRAYRPTTDAEHRILADVGHSPYLLPTLELVQALRQPRRRGPNRRPKL
jgi:hypothetical protein